MKKIFLMMAVMSATIFASCTKDANDLTNEIIDPAQGSVVTLSFSDEAPQTRAFFGTTATAETWEKSITNVIMYAFKDGNMIAYRAFTDDELAVKRATFPLSGVRAGDVCNFYAVTNALPQVEGYISEKEFLNLIENAPSNYNGTFAQVSTGAKRSLGFVMSGKATATVSSGTTNVALTLKRTVAKIAVQAKLADNFHNIYLGDIKVKDITISKAASQSYIWKQTSPNTGARNFSFNQVSNVSGKNYQNLFYIYENAATSDKVTLTINAIYDIDGDYSTTTDQKEVTYTLGLDGKTAGEIARNGYYRVAVTIKGLTGSDASMSITVADWEVTSTQDVEIGN